MNQSGQVLVVDGIIENGKSGYDARSIISSGGTLSDSVRDDFLKRYRCVVEGSMTMLSGTTLYAKVYEEESGTEATGISESEFTWADTEGTVYASGIAHCTLNQSHMSGKREKQFMLIWEHHVKYMVGTSERYVTVKQNILFTITTDVTTEYMWSTEHSEHLLDKKSGKWRSTVPTKPNDGKIYYLWTRVSYDNGITFVYYMSTTWEGPNSTTSSPVNPQAKIQLILDKYYFERSGKKADGTKGDYISGQKIQCEFDYSGVDGNEKVHLYADEDYNSQIDVWPKLSDKFGLSESHMRNKSSITIIVEYAGMIVDRVKISERIIEPDFAGKLDTDNPALINGRAPAEGDSFFYINEKGEIILRVRENDEWVDLDGTYAKDADDIGVPNQHFADVMSKALPYIVERRENLPDTEHGPYSFFKNLAAYSAFIKNLFAENLVVSNENADKKVFNTTVGMDSVTKKITFKVSYDGKTVFQIDPETGNVFIGQPNDTFTLPASGLMFSPENNLITSKDGLFTVSNEGKVTTTDGQFKGNISANDFFLRGTYMTAYTWKKDVDSSNIVYASQINCSQYDSMLIIPVIIDGPCPVEPISIMLNDGARSLTHSETIFSKKMGIYDSSIIYHRDGNYWFEINNLYQVTFIALRKNR